MATRKRSTHELSPRHVREIGDRMRAQLVLGDDPRYRWLCDRSQIENGRPKSWRPAVLGELGRLAKERGKDEMLAVATELCESQPTTAEALVRVRQARMQDRAEPSLELSTKLLAAIDQYRQEHPDLDDEQVVAALEDALGIVQATQE